MPYFPDAVSRGRLKIIKFLEVGRHKNKTSNLQNKIFTGKKTNELDYRLL